MQSSEPHITTGEFYDIANTRAHPLNESIGQIYSEIFTVRESINTILNQLRGAGAADQFCKFIHAFLGNVRRIYLEEKGRPNSHQAADRSMKLPVRMIQELLDYDIEFLQGRTRSIIQQLIDNREVCQLRGKQLTTEPNPQDLPEGKEEKEGGISVQSFYDIGNNRDHPLNPVIGAIYHEIFGGDSGINNFMNQLESAGADRKFRSMIYAFLRNVQGLYLKDNGQQARVAPDPTMILPRRVIEQILGYNIPLFANGLGGQVQAILDGKEIDAPPSTLEREAGGYITAREFYNIGNNEDHPLYSMISPIYNHIFRTRGSFNTIMDELRAAKAPEGFQKLIFAFLKTVQNLWLATQKEEIGGETDDTSMQLPVSAIQKLLEYDLPFFRGKIKNRITQLLKDETICRERHSQKHLTSMEKHPPEDMPERQFEPSFPHSPLWGDRWKNVS